MSGTAQGVNPAFVFIILAIIFLGFAIAVALLG